ncbi:MAG: galactokinase [Lachnospiraceae bacterium]|nr:galactokinase [Lachnospiraceae bacterium]
MRDKIIKEFTEQFGEGGDIRLFFAPGRVNLIGEHTDYNGGHVFPCALTIGTFAAVRRRSDRTVRFYSMNFENEGVITLDLDTELKPSPELRWVNYPAGIIWAFKERGLACPNGFDIVYCGTIPNGSGLSSSASIEVLTGFVLKSLFGFEVTNIDLAKIGQFSENKFNGVNCGIMDQFAIAMGKKDHAIFLDTSDLKFEYVPVRLDGIRVVIGNTNKKRGLGDSKYNERRSECENALEILRKTCDIKTLGDLNEEGFDAVCQNIEDPVVRKRAKHAVYENRRTIRAVEALNNNNIKLFGELMNASHVSLRDDYEVTGIELDTLVEEAWKQPGVLGSRMTGAGFGGCTVSLVESDKIDAFIDNVGRAYLEKIGYAADFYVVDIGDGPAEINN